MKFPQYWGELAKHSNPNLERTVQDCLWLLKAFLTQSWTVLFVEKRHPTGWRSNQRHTVEKKTEIQIKPKIKRDKRSNHRNDAIHFITISSDTQVFQSE